MYLAAIWSSNLDKSRPTKWDKPTPCFSVEDSEHFGLIDALDLGIGVWISLTSAWFVTSFLSRIVATTPGVFRCKCRHFLSLRRKCAITNLPPLKVDCLTVKKAMEIYTPAASAAAILCCVQS